MKKVLLSFMLVVNFSFADLEGVRGVAALAGLVVGLAKEMKKDQNNSIEQKVSTDTNLSLQTTAAAISKNKDEEAEIKRKLLSEKYRGIPTNVAEELNKQGISSSKIKKLCPSGFVSRVWSSPFETPSPYANIGKCSVTNFKIYAIKSRNEAVGEFVDGSPLYIKFLNKIHREPISTGRMGGLIKVLEPVTVRNSFGATKVVLTFGVL